MKKNTVLLLILGVLSITALLFYFIKGSPSQTGMDISDRQFRMENTDDIAVISIERKRYPKIILTKKGSEWLLNNGRKSREEVVNYIFSVLKKLTLKYIPNQASTQNIYKSIEKDGIKVMLFDHNNKMLKSFYIGHEVGDGSGTAFLMEGAKQPFVMFVRGFEGSIRARFLFNMNEFETKDIFVEKAENIEEIEIKYPFDKASSFTLRRNFLHWEHFNPYTNIKLPKFNEKLVDPYLLSFSNIVAEYNDASNANKEMILQQPIFCEITLKRKNGSSRHAVLYSLDNIEFNVSQFSPKELGEDVSFMVHTDNDEFFLIQKRVIGKLLVSFDSFAVR